MKLCCTCKLVKPENHFSKNKSLSDGLQKSCKDCRVQAGKKYYLKHKVSIQLYHKKYRVNNTEKIKQRGQAYYKLTGGIHQRRYFERLKDEFFIQYGEVCCGPTGNNDCIHGGVNDRRLLTIAHLFGDGAIHRREIGSDAPTNIMIDLRKRGWPKNIGINVQCHNCQHLHWLNQLQHNKHKTA